MLPLDEYAKVCGLIASCNDIINGKFILANYKIANILKNISNSKEVYNLLANCLNNFDFEREFSRAQLRSASHTSKLVLPTDKEKLLPFVFCLLYNLDNNSINFDMFLKEFYHSDNGHGEEFSAFASAVIVPFRDFIAAHFGIPLDKARALTVEQSDNASAADEVKSEILSATLAEKQPNSDEEYDDDNEFSDEDFEDKDDDDDEDNDDDNDEDDDDDESYPELTEAKVEKFLHEVRAICNEILTGLAYERKLKEYIRDDIEYIANAIIACCDDLDLNNACALVTAIEYVAHKAKGLRFLTKELKRLVCDLYD